MSRLMVWLQLIAVVWQATGVGKLGVEASPVSDSIKEGLYSTKDDVIILNKKNAGNLIYDKSMVWVIEFYNSWCGHCIHFAPTWRQFASDLKGWRQVVSVGALDCANDENLDICRTFNINAYPSIKLLPPNFSKDMVTTKLTQLNTQNQQEMKDVILEYVTTLSPAPPSWPNLKPLQTVEEIWMEVKDVHEYALIVFEDERSTVGRQVILDLLNYPRVLVRTMLKDNAGNLGVLKFPSLYSVTDKSTLIHITSGSGMAQSDRRRFVDTLLSKMGFIDSNGKRVKANPDFDLPGAGETGKDVIQFHQPHNENKTQITEHKSLSTAVHMQDLESALHYAFRQEIAICNTIDGAKLGALRNFISALAKFFPGRAAVTQFLWKVVDFLSSLEKPLTGGTWVNAIDSLQDQKAFLPYQVRWVGCKGSLPLYRGYPCSMWTLFHTLTVAAHQHSGPVNALEVPLAIRGYMEHFFGCQECSHNFLKMAATLEAEVSKPLDAVLWLWAAHNKANKRLHGDASEDPQHLKIQFPSPEACPSCHKEDNAKSVPEWNMKAVATFLVRLYGKNSIVQDVHLPATNDPPPRSRPKNREELDWWEKKQRESDLKKIREMRDKKKKERQPAALALAEVHQDRRAEVIDVMHEGGKVARKVDYSVAGIRPVGRSSWGFGFSHVDLGVCMAFYVTCAAIIVLLYYHFIVHKKFRLPCHKYLPV